MLYHTPQVNGKEDYIKRVPINVIQACKYQTGNGKYQCDESFYELCCILLSEKGPNAPTSAIEAKHLYLTLQEQILTDLRNI